MSNFATYEYLRLVWDDVFKSPHRFGELMDWYDGVHDRSRRYHTADHVRECVSHLRLLRDDVLSDASRKNVNQDVALAALLFHDAFYRVEHVACEERSAQMYRQWASANTTWKEELRTSQAIKDVEDAILATEREDVPRLVESPTSRLVADADVLFLATNDVGQLIEYEDKIRGEYEDYQASGLTNWPSRSTPGEADERYEAARGNVLFRLLEAAKNHSLYLTPEVDARYTARAASNLSFLLGVVGGRRVRRAAP